MTSSQFLTSEHHPTRREVSTPSLQVTVQSGHEAGSPHAAEVVPPGAEGAPQFLTGSWGKQAGGMTQPGTRSPDSPPFSNVVKGSTRWTVIRPQVSVFPRADTCPQRRLIHPTLTSSPPWTLQEQECPLPQAAHPLSIWGLLESSSVEILPPCNPGTLQEPRKGEVLGPGPRNRPPPRLIPLGASLSLYPAISSLLPGALRRRGQL